MGKSENLPHLVYYCKVQSFVGYVTPALSFFAHHSVAYARIFACGSYASVIDRSGANLKCDIIAFLESSGVICCMLFLALRRIPSIRLFSYLIDSRFCVLTVGAADVLQSNLSPFQRKSLFPLLVLLMMLHLRSISMSGLQRSSSTRLLSV